MSSKDVNHGLGAEKSEKPDRILYLKDLDNKAED